MCLHSLVAFDAERASYQAPRTWLSFTPSSSVCALLIPIHPHPPARGTVHVSDTEPALRPWTTRTHEYRRWNRNLIAETQIDDENSRPERPYENGRGQRVAVTLRYKLHRGIEGRTAGPTKSAPSDRYEPKTPPTAGCPRYQELRRMSCFKAIPKVGIYRGEHSSTTAVERRFRVPKPRVNSVFRSGIPAGKRANVQFDLFFEPELLPGTQVWVFMRALATFWSACWLLTEYVGVSSIFTREEM